MKMALTLIILFAFITGTAQKEGSKKLPVIEALNLKAREANGNIRFHKPGKPLIIEEGGITGTEMGVKISVTLNETGYPKSTWTSKFNPANIAYIYDAEMPAESPIG